MNHQVFVYGTLRKGGTNHHLLRDAELQAVVKLKGFEMWDFGSYPGVTSSENDDDTIEAEFYSVDDETLAFLDRLEDFYGENHPRNLYDRDLIQDDFGHKGWIYVFRRQLLSLPFFKKRSRKVISGVWNKFNYSD